MSENDSIRALLDSLMVEVAAETPLPVPEAHAPDTKALCLQYLHTLKNLPSYRIGIAAALLVDIAYEFAVLNRMVEFFRLRDGPVAALAGPAVAQLADICAAEGIRRGVILMSGEDVTVRNFALDLVDEMVAAFTPTWAARL